ncbi:MFS transporter [Candidatus Bathyarchaeota archaeon]|nr:MFS transporter [Candidatus Bathyarchaeota archaeon]
MSPLAGAFGGLLASAILSLDSIGSLHSWRMIFAVEGIITIGLGLIAFATMTDRPETARWLTQEEKDIAIARVKCERVGQTEVVDKLNGRKAWLGFWNPVVLATAAVFFMNNITVQGLAFFLPTIVGQIYSEESTVRKQLYTVPPYIVGAFFTLFFPALSWKTDKRQIFIIFSAPLVMAGYIMFLASENSQVRYAATFLLASSCTTIGPLANAQVAVQVVSDTSRAVSLATNMMFGNTGGLVATWSYIQSDAPNYPIGHGLNVAASTFILLFGTLALLWMNYDNKQRDKKDIDKELEGLSPKEIENLEWKHPGWRWKP